MFYCSGIPYLFTLAIETLIFVLQTIYVYTIYMTLESKFLCACTKAEAIIANIFVPNILNILYCNIKHCTFVAVLTGASNLNETKLFPLFVRYFDWRSGIKVKILELNSLPNDTSHAFSNFVAIE